MPSTTSKSRVYLASDQAPRDQHAKAPEPTSPRVAVGELAAALSAGESDDKLRERLFRYTVSTGALDSHLDADDIDAAKVAAIALASERESITEADLCEALGYVGLAPRLALQALVRADILDRLVFIEDGKRNTAAYVLSRRVDVREDQR